MPYISQTSRTPYLNLIENAVKTICEEKEFARAELLGFFIQEIFYEFLGHRLANTYQCVELDLQGFQEPDKIKNLKQIVEFFSAHLLKNSDLFSQAGELNYIISAVVWGVLGDSMHAGENARYGFRVYIKGIILRITDQMDKLSSLRREIIGQGVLSDVVDEMYRRKTSVYEDKKIAESGDVWPLKSFSFVEKAPFQQRISETFESELI